MSSKINAKVTVKSLKDHARALHISNFSRLNKAALQTLIYTIQIQRQWRKKKQKQKNGDDTTEKKVVKPHNDTDPFTLESMENTPSEKLFFHIENPTTVWQFHPTVLYEYFLRTGTFQNPFTRTEFNFVELKRLHRQLLSLLPRHQHATLVPIHLYFKQITQTRREEEELKRTVDLLTEEALAGVEPLWRIQPYPLPNDSYIPVMQQLFMLCQHTLPTFVAQINIIKQLDRNMARLCVEKALTELRIVAHFVPNPFHAASRYSLAQRNSAVTSVNVLTDFYYNNFVML